MIISRTPLRISFFGGGTDYPSWCIENGGAVLSTTVDKYCYITVRHLPPFFEHKHRIVYSKIENVSSIDEVIHPAVREVLRFMEIPYGLEIHHDGDLPARSGLGSSSSFTVGLLHALHAVKGKTISKDQLASEAIFVEHKMIKENVGSQDQVAAAFGGFNKILFHHDESIEVSPIILPRERLIDLQSHMLLVFTGLSRIASEIAQEQISNTKNNENELRSLRQMVEEAINILNNDSTSLRDFGKLLDEAWNLKRGLSSKISNSIIDSIYQKARECGALGGKILGAGGGGFMLLFAPPETHEIIKEKLQNLLFIPFAFENSGSQIIVYKPDGFSHIYSYEQKK